jgi:dTDP-D-glucose 4,6-dehydratase
MADAAGQAVAVEHAPPRPGELRRNALDASRAQIHLGWRAWTDLASGVEAVLGYLQVHSAQGDQSSP